MPVGDILPELSVLIAAVVILLAVLFLPRRRQWFAAPLALAGLAVALVLSVLQWSKAPTLTFHGVWTIDGAGVVAKVLVLGVTAVAVTLSPEWFRGDRRHGEYYTVLLLCALGAMLMVGASDTLQLMMGVLLSSITAYTLTAYHRDWPLSLEAGMKFFLIGALTNALMVVGLAYLFGVFGSTAYEVMAERMTANAAAASPLFPMALALVLLGVLFKLAAVPAHAWMPDVAQGAPAPAAAFVSVVPKIGAAVAVARLVSLFPAEAVAWRPLVAAIAVATMTLGNLAALWQQDVRRLLGWSAVSQSGYALVAVAVIGLSEQAVPALLLFLTAYAFANLAAFAVVTELRGRTRLEDYRGLGTARPWAALVLTLSLLSLVGIPPLAGFAGKLALFAAAIDGGYAWLAVVALVNTVVSLFYYLRVIAPMYFDEAPEPVAVLGRWALFGMIPAAAGVVGLGFGAEGVLALIHQKGLWTAGG